MKKITQLDLFSGIGGFHLGFERAGYKVKSYFSEIDKHAVAVYKNQFKDSEYVGSVIDIKGDELPNIDLITFGSPCQDFSLAGKRQGMQGERSSLILEAIRLISECRPRVFIWENVKGTFSSNSGEDFAAILQAFANIGGYRLEWQLLNTSWFLPQNRERIYLVGYSTTTKRSWRGVFPIGATRGADNESSKKKHNKVISPTICTNYWRFANDTPVFVEPNYTYKKVNETIEQNPSAFREGEARMMDLHNRKVQDISPCLVEPHHNGAALFNGSRIRRLTPIECERLQGFPDNHTQYGNYNGEVKEMSNTQRYKQCGNAVTVDVVQAIANKIKPLF